MKNLLTLHEAVAVVLLKQPNQTATFQTIANEIERRNLFTERKGGITLAEQINLPAGRQDCGLQLHQANTNIGLNSQDQILSS